MRARTFNIMQYVNHPTTGEPLINEATIKLALGHQSFEKWAYILHDQDVYSEKDEADALKRYNEAEKALKSATASHQERDILDALTSQRDRAKDFAARCKAGDYKPPHYHIVAKVKNNALDTAIVARWFGISENYIDVPKGRGAFEDCVQYLTHERDEQQALGKRLYADENVFANFDFRQALTARAEKVEVYGSSELSKLDEWIFDINHGKKTLNQCFYEDPILYGNNEDKLIKNRRIFLKMQKPPKSRINIYVGARRRDGSSGGVGKSLASRAVALSIVHAWPGWEDKTDEEVYFEVGAENVTFEGYDGQPVIIWNDCKAITLLEKLKSRENVYNVFDTHPGPVPVRQNIKNSFIPMNQTINIINSSQTPTEFLDALAGEYTKPNGEKIKVDDKTQVYRRIVITMELHEEDFDIAFNKGYFENSDDFSQYAQYQGITGNFQQLKLKLSERQALAVGARMTKRIGDKVKTKLDEEARDEDADEDTLAEFDLYGLDEEEKRELLAKQVEELKTIQNALNSGTATFRDDLTEEDIQAASSEFARALRRMEKQFEKSGVLTEWREFQKKLNQSRAIAIWQERHGDGEAIPMGDEYDAEIKAIEEELAANYGAVLSGDYKNIKEV